MKNKRIITITGCFLALLWSFWFIYNHPIEVVDSGTIPKDIVAKVVKTHGFEGWEMPCNYDKGSSADWIEKEQKYGDQKYLSCANGLNYVSY